MVPHVKDAWIDQEKTKIGYEISFNRYFYVFEPPRELAAIDAELKQLADIAAAQSNEFKSVALASAQPLARGEIDEDGTLKGDLILVASGDPSFGSRTMPAGTQRRSCRLKRSSG